MQKTLLFILLLFFIHISFISKANEIRFRKLTTREGLTRKNCLWIEQDSVGFIWFSSFNGILRYNGYEIKEYIYDARDTNSIASGMVASMHTDYFGNIWFGGNALSLYNWGKDNFINYQIDFDYEFFINSISSDYHGNIWMGTKKGLYYLDKKLDKVIKTDLLVDITRIEVKYPLIYITTEKSYALIYNIEKKEVVEKLNPNTYKNFHPEDASVKCMFVEDDSTFWIGGKSRIYAYKNKVLKRYNIPLEASDPNYILYSIYVHDKENIWLGTQNFGLVIFNSKTESVTNYRKNSKSEFSLTSNSVACIYMDLNKTVWLGTHNGGISYCSLNDNKLKYHSSENPDEGNVITSFAEDISGNVLIAKDGGGISVVDKNKKQIHKIDRNNGLITNAVTDLQVDPNGNIYISQWHGGVTKFDKNYKLLRKNILTIEAMPYHNVKGLLIDSNNRLWIFSPFYSLVIYDIKTDKLYYKNKPGKFNQELFTDINLHDAYEDFNGDVWILGSTSLLKYTSANDVIRYTTNIKDDKSIISNNIQNVFNDSKNRLWVSTLKGLELYNYKTNSFRHIGKEYNFPTNVYAIEEDSYGTLWFTSPKGFGSFHPKDMEITYYDKNLKIVGDDFKERSVLKTQKGEILFGSNDGYISFFPNEISINNRKPEVLISSFEIFNKKIDYYSNPDIVNRNIETVDRIVVKYAQSVLSFQFAALNYISPSKNQYAYRLEGFDKDWNYLGNERKAVYTNLNPGTYTLKFKAANNEGVWNNNVRKVILIVKPPWYMTILFKVILVFFIIGTILLIYTIRVKNIKRHNRLLEQKVRMRTAELLDLNAELSAQKDEIEKQNEFITDQNTVLVEKSHEIETQSEELAEKNLELYELNKTKDKFFSIIGHDLKNPMSTLMGFTELLSDYFDKYSNEKKKEFVKIIMDTSKNLFNLLENLLTWSRSQSGNMPFAPKELNLSGVINNNILLLKISAKKKNVSIKYISKNSYTLFADENMMNAILRNIISNAIKFTPNSGEINIKVDNSNVNSTVIIISDNGIGMTKDQLDGIFQLDKTISTKGTDKEEGTGLGLILCKEFVNRHMGKIWVESRQGNGTSFYLEFPKG